MTTITTIRASSLSTYGDCARRFAAVTFRQEVTEAGYDLAPAPLNNIGAAIGTGVHGGVASMLIGKMETGEAVSERQAEECAIAEFEEASKDGLQMDTVTPVAHEAPLQILRMLKAYRLVILPQVEPMAVERRIEVSAGDGFVLSGQSDVQTVDGGAIRDLKTGKQLRTHYPQLGAYSLLCRSKHRDRPIDRLVIDFVPRAILNKPQPAPIIVEYDQATAEQAAMSAIEHIKRDAEVFRARVNAPDGLPPEHAFLANPGSQLCSPKFCPAHGSRWCREHKL